MARSTPWRSLPTSRVGFSWPSSGTGWTTIDPWCFRTNDYGESWELLTDGSNGIPGDYPVRVVREDPDSRGLLYAGTDFGLFVSFDDGAHWQPFQQNLPITQVADMQVKEQDLVVATHGRSIWILDDLTPLHQLAEGVRGGGSAETSAIGDVQESEKILFNPGLTYRLQRAGRGGDRAMENPPNGAVIRYYLAEEPDDSVEVTLTLRGLPRRGDP